VIEMKKCEMASIAPAPLYSRGERIVMSIIASLIVFGFSFNVTRSVVWRVTGYIPPVRCGSVQAEFERQVAEGALRIDYAHDTTIGDSNGVGR
jgi:hypothetical protein